MERNLAIRVQTRLGVTADGVFGPISWRTLFERQGANRLRAQALARAMIEHGGDYGITGNSLRLAHFIAQVGHESGSFRHMEEIWGPTPAQRRYEGRKDLGNVRPGDGIRYKGRGPIQLTGRANYREFGRLLGLDLEGNPEQAADPFVGLRIAMLYWHTRKINAPADRDDVRTVTRLINGGFNGLEDRQRRTTALKALLA